MNVRDTPSAIVSEPKALLIFPCGGNGIEALDCLGTEYRCIGFIDDAPAKQGGACFGLPVLPRTALSAHPDAYVLAVPGSPVSFRERRRLIEGLGVEQARYARVIHPHARISPLATIGRNALVMAGVVVTSNATIGDHVCILPNSVVHHDARIGDWTLVGANVTLAGAVRIGTNCYVGSGSSIKNGISVHDGALIGIGSNVLRDGMENATVAGNPARALR